MENKGGIFMCKSRVVPEEINACAQRDKYISSKSYYKTESIQEKADWLYQYISMYFDIKRTINQEKPHYVGNVYKDVEFSKKIGYDIFICITAQYVDVLEYIGLEYNTDGDIISIETVSGGNIPISDFEDKEKYRYMCTYIDLYEDKKFRSLIGIMGEIGKTEKYLVELKKKLKILEERYEF